MTRVMNIDVLMNLVCSASLLSKNLNLRPDVCLPPKAISFPPVASRKVSSVSDLCLKPGCIKEDSEHTNDLSVNIGHLASLANISSDYDFCLTPGCVKAAVQIISSLNENVEPCEDFYQFACGGWLNNHEVPNSETYISISFEMEDLVELQLRDLLESEITENEPECISDMKLWYDDCMKNHSVDERSVSHFQASKVKDTSSTKEVGYEPLKIVLKDFGGWPALEQENWNSSSFDWIDTLIRLRNLGYDGDIFIRFNATQDIRNSTVYMIKTLPENTTYFLSGQNDSFIDAYFDVIVEAALTLGANISTSVDELREALNFEIMLEQLYFPLKERSNGSSTNNTFTLQKLIEEVPQLDWLKYLNGLLHKETLENDTLFVMDKHFVKRFFDFIEKTNKRVVANYLMWKVVNQYFSLISRDSITLEQESEEEPWKQCLYPIMKAEEFNLSSYYMEHHLKKETKKDILNIFKYVHFEFLNIIQKTKWLDAETKSRAKEKANAMKLYIGNPKDPRAFIFVSDLYKNLARIDFDKPANMRDGFKGKEWTRNSQLHPPFIARFIAKLRFIRKCEIVLISLLVTPERRNNNEVDVFEAGAGYVPEENAVELSATYLQHPNFNKDRPQYLNFAAIGAAIGHEISHAFDEEGRHFDKHGNNVNWFSKDAVEIFEERTKCFIEQYSNYTDIYGRRVDAITTLNENIADVGGLRAAYLAYQSWVRDHKREGKLPGLKNYTQDQLFFIGAVSVMCEKYRYELNPPKSDHAPEEIRVLGMLSNMPEFAEAFHCSKNSAMNRKNKCRIW